MGDRWKAALVGYAVTIIVGALFPGLRYGARWRRRSRRAFAISVALDALMTFVVKQFVLPKIREWGRGIENARATLERELGRPATPEELHDYLMSLDARS